MTARRQARAKAPLEVRSPAGSTVPTAFEVGRCVEVWALEGAASPQHSAGYRFDAARSGWARRAHASDAEMLKLIPDGAPWSVEFLSYQGQAERTGHEVAEVVTERLAAAGCRLSDLPDLRDQAEELYAASLGTGSLRRAHERYRAGRNA